MNIPMITGTCRAHRYRHVVAARCLHAAYGPLGTSPPDKSLLIVTRLMVNPTRCRPATCCVMFWPYEEAALPVVAPEVEFYLVNKNTDPDYELLPKGRSGRRDGAPVLRIDAVAGSGLCRDAGRFCRSTTA